ncbi:hypothetical protein [Streptomyces flavalbus]|uniref:Ig-like domain-containing protein n=1 Tax=Streptomyces flavalbus TaxID=2665155 RepID=A0ABW2WLD9_9ACTN
MSEAEVDGGSSTGAVPQVRGEGRGRPSTAKGSGEPGAGQREFAHVVREQIFGPLASRGWSYARISERLGAGPWFGADVLRRIADGRCVPDREALEAVLDLVGEVSGTPVTREARDHVRQAYLRALEQARAGLHRWYMETFANDQLRAETARVRHQHLVQPSAGTGSGGDGGESAPHAALALRREVARHVDDVVRGGVVLPVRLLGPEPAEPVDVTAVLDEVDDVLQHVARVLHRAIAADEAAMAAAEARRPEPTPTPPPSPEPVPVPVPPTVVGHPGDGDDGPGRGGRVAGYVTTAVLVVAAVLLAAVYLPSLRDEDAGGGSDTATGPTASSTPGGGDGAGAGAGDGGDGNGGRGSGPGPVATGDRDGANGQGGQEEPDATATTPDDGGGTVDDPGDPEVSDDPTRPDTEQDTGPVLGGAGINASPRLDGADCSQPVVFTFSAAAQRPGTIEYTWHPDDRLIARGVQSRAGTMTFTAPNEQHEEFSVQLTGTQPGERVQGGMTVEVTSPQADRTVIGDSFDLTCT